MANDIYKYVGKVTGATIDDNTGFDTLNKEKVFIRRELILSMKDGVKFPVGNPDFMEFTNSAQGREDLKASGINSNLIDAIMIVWGDEPVIEDPIIN